MKRKTLHSSSLVFLGRSTLLNFLFALEAGIALVLDLVIAAVLGFSTTSDLLYAAWMLPQMIGRGIFQSLTAALMGLFLHQKNKMTAYNHAITVIAAAGILTAALFSLTSGLWLPISVPGIAGDIGSEAVPLAGIFSLMIAFLAIAETLRAVFYRENKKWWPTLSRFIAGLTTVSFVLFAGYKQNLALVAIAITAGTALEAAMDLAGFRWLLGFKIKLLWPNKDLRKEMRSVIGAPLLGSSVRVVAGTVERALASLLLPGSVVAVTYANRIINALDRLVFRGFVITTVQMHEGKKKLDLRANIRLVVIVALPITLIFAVLLQPLITVLFARGRFTSADVQTLTLVLQLYTPAILGIALTRIPFGLAYAQKHTKAILGFFVLSSITLILSEALFILAGLELYSFGLGYTLSIWVAYIWLYRLILKPRQTRLMNWIEIAQFVLIALIALAGTYWVTSLVRQRIFDSQQADWLILAFGIAGCACALVVAAVALRLEEARFIIRRALKSMGKGGRGTKT
ncbi:lipid II flippase MurJ [Acidobacteriota bacterium]